MRSMIWLSSKSVDAWSRWMVAVALAAGLTACGDDNTGGNTTGTTDVEEEQDAGDVAAEDAADTAAVDTTAADVPAGACASDKDCEGKTKADANKCEVSVCKAGKCEVGYAADGATCDDGKECTSNDKCSAGGQCAGSVDCVAKGTDGKPDLCKAGSCDDAGKCAYVPKPFGTACDDGNPCTIDDKCAQGGKCTSATLKNCADDGNPCTDEGCDGDTGDCKSTTKAAGEPCNDGSACTVNDACNDKAACLGQDVTCVDDNNPCTLEVCDTLKGCTTKAQADGKACDDGTACTYDDICVNKVCKGKAELAIDDNDPCTVDTCEGKGLANPKITHTPKTSGACDDGDPCTKNDACSSGGCQGAALVCNDGNPCTDDQCDPKKCAAGDTGCGQCVSLPMKDGSACSDNNACTAKDACSAGLCKGVDLLATGGCDDKNPCTTDGCQPGAGCINVPTDPAATKFCDDGNPCTEIDKCASATCKGVPRDCKDTDPCTNDTCDPKALDIKKACLHDPYDGPCDDNDKCTSGDLCAGGVCAGVKVNCDDKNPCTIDVCDALKGCTYKFAQGGTACDDGLSCTVNDYCDAGKCVSQKDTCQACSTDLNCKPLDDNDLCNGQVKCIDAGAKGKVCAVDLKTVVKCDASADTPCSVNTCNKDSGVCAPNIKAEGLACTSTDKCVTGATCNATGACVGKTLTCDDKNDCTVDSCDPAAGCKFATKADDTACDDGTLCTPANGDKCKAGKCVNPVNTCACTTDAECATYDSKDGDLCNEKYKCVLAPGGTGKFCAPVAGTQTVCDATKDTPCTVATCEKASGQCKPVTKADSTACDDKNLCTIGDFCKAGVCTPAKSLVCDDKNPCTDEICSPAFGCASGAKPAGSKCDDGDACTTGDTCKSGVCSGVKLVCDDGNPCTLDLCSKTNGCNNQIDNTLACDDGNPCTGKDVCKDGLCAGPAINCDDKNPCTVDACDGNGGCKNINVDGKDCDDGDACTVGDVCKTNQCLGVAKTCDDGNACTEDSCKLGACVQLAALGKDCDDGNACTSTDKCDSKGVCTGLSYKCDDSNPCIAYPNGCLPTLGCVKVQKDGAPGSPQCSDSDACTTFDKCTGGACVGQPIPCDDGNVCTNDVCDKVKGCQITQNTCNDQNPCTTDTCDKTKGCQHTPLDGTVCNDGDACTDQTKCLAGKCIGVPTKCDDSNGCTIDSCDSQTGCVFTPGKDGEVTCDDKNPCTDDTCQAGKCVGAAKVCDDKNPCTVDSCDKLKGCVTTDVPQGAACDDGDSCTLDTKCLSGICAGGTIDKGCGTCQTDTDCNIFDNNNRCDGAYSCKQSAVSGLKLCYFDPNPVVCDTTGDTACKKNTCQTATGQCVMTDSINGTKCEDGLGCTSADVCLNGACKGGVPTDCSKAGDACNDATCEETGKPGGFTCVAKPKEGSPACDADGNGCTANDFCEAGKCKAGTAVDCTGVAKTCEVAACKSTGANTFQCAISTAPDGSVCNDNQLCTEGDFCKTGKCQPGTKPKDCSDLTSTCADGICDKTGNGGLGACVPKPKNDGQACDSDANGCTQGDKCVAGACVAGAPPDCTGSTTQCAVGACQSTGAGTYKCVGAPKKDNLPCDADQNGCTVGDACLIGKCVAGKPLDCSAKNSADGCQVGVCKAPPGLAAFCDIGFADKGKTCNADGNGCTLGDTCNGQGACQPGAAVDCLGVTTGCSQGICKSTGDTTYVCQGDPKPDGSKCDADKSGCTQNDTCLAGKCSAGKPIDCAAELKVSPTACTTPTCVASGSETYQCDNASNKDGTPCNFDSNGCTFNDACQLGFCAAGELQTCAKVSSLCADAKCTSTGDNAFKCDATPKESYPPLDPPEPCTPTIVPTTCQKGYKCELLDAVLNIGQCLPTVTLYCDDNDKCTEADACAGGKCTAGKQKDCDDKDPCTLDSCSAGVCKNAAIAGCVACLKEDFEPVVPLSWVATSTDANATKYVLWQSSDKKAFAGQRNFRAEWKGPAPAGSPSTINTNLIHRRLYTQDSIQATLDFYLSMDVGAQNCGMDDLQVLINNIKVWEKCDNVGVTKVEPGTTYQRISIDVTKFAGAPMDVEFRVVAGTVADSKGTIDIDNVRLSGACGPGCLGTTFEPRIVDPETPPVDLVNASLPQPWRLESTDLGYVGWAAQAGTGHTGIGYLAANYSGAPASGKQETAKITIPKIFAAQGDKLWFALRAPEVGDAACGNDDFIVRIAGKEAFKRCNALANWQTFSVDLPAAQTVDVEMVVVTGFGASAKGKWEIDDVGVSGNCQYACYLDTFDSGGFSTNYTTNAKQATIWKPWSITTTLAKSPTGSAFNQFLPPNLPKDNTNNSFVAKKDVLIGVLGGSYSYNYNLFVKTAKCPDISVFMHRITMNAVDPNNEQLGIDKDADGNATVQVACQSTSGWSSVLADIPSKVYGTAARVYFATVKTPGNDTLKLYLDDLIYMCK